VTCSAFGGPAETSDNGSYGESRGFPRWAPSITDFHFHYGYFEMHCLQFNLFGRLSQR